MKDFVYYTRFAVSEERYRLWRLGVLVFVFVIAVGLNYTGSGAHLFRVATPSSARGLNE